MSTMLFNPYTGRARHPSDIKSDPRGLLIVEPDAPLMAAAPAVHGQFAYLGNDDAYLIVGDRKPATQPCGIDYTPVWVEGNQGHIYQESNWACKACGYVGKHDRHPGCQKPAPAAAWVPVTQALLNEQHDWLYRPMWIARKDGTVLTGHYEWRQGRNPDRFYTEAGGDEWAFDATHVMPIVPPTAPKGPAA